MLSYFVPLNALELSCAHASNLLPCRPVFCINPFLSVSAYVYISTYYMYVCISPCRPMSVLAYVYVPAYVYLSAYVYVSAFVCISLCLYEPTIQIHISTYVCLHLVFSG